MDDALALRVAATFGSAPQTLGTAAGAHTAVSGRFRHPILELTSTGFVVQSDGPPDLRGYVDIMRGDVRVARRLVICAWAVGGRIGYEFKRRADGTRGARPIPHSSRRSAEVEGAD
ncbi:MAG: hypothetical protein AAF713_01190 [Pseudomonadota bacterium]